MAIVRPFEACYDPAVVGAIASVLAPPYDVIGSEEQAASTDQPVQRHSPGSVARPRPLRRGQPYVRQWRERGVLVRDREPAFFVRAAPPAEERRRTRRYGFFARLHLEEFASGKVLPHERTLASPKADRLALQRACRANLSSIFGLYSSPGFALSTVAAPAIRTPAWADFEDGAAVHRFWRVAEADVQESLRRQLEAAQCTSPAATTATRPRCATASGARDRPANRKSRSTTCSPTS
jgi:uncharacterized protein (DUF1015 family)